MVFDTLGVELANLFVLLDSQLQDFLRCVPACMSPSERR